MTDRPGAEHRSEPELSPEQPASRWPKVITKYVGRHGFRNISWGFADQALYSATNLATVMIVARYATQVELGRFAIVMSAFYLSQGIIRALTGEVLVVRLRTLPEDERAGAADDALSGAVGYGMVAAALLAVIAVIAGGEMLAPLLTMAIVLVGVTLQDESRYGCFARLASRDALAADLDWTVVQVALFALAIITGRTEPAWFIAAWGASGTISGIRAMHRAGRHLHPRRVRAWARDSRSLAPYFVGESFASTGTSQARTFAISGVAGLSTVGAMRGANILMSPLSTLFQGAAGPVVAQLSNAAASNRYDLVRTRAFQLAVFAAVASIALGTFVYLLPDQVGSALIGESWPESHDLIPLVTIAMVGSGISLGALVGLRAIEAAKAGLTARVIVGVGLLIVGTVGAAINGAPGAVSGLAVAQILGAGLWWKQFLREHRKVAALHPRVERKRDPGDE